MSAIEYFCFGDESCFLDIATYAIAGLKRDNINAVENVLSDVKNRYGIHFNDEIHCKEMFHPAAKKKTNFNKLPEKQIQQLLLDIAIGVHKYVIPSVGIYDHRHFKNVRYKAEQTGEIFIPGEGKDKKKLWQGFAFQAAAPLIERRFGVKNTKFWVDYDHTKIGYFNKTKKKQYRTYRSWCAKSGEWLEPEPQPQNKPYLLQLADILAYSSAHAFQRKYHKRKFFFKQIVKVLNPDISTCFPTIGGDSMMTIQYKNREIK